MIKNYILNSKKLVFILGIVYLILNFILAKFFEQTFIAKKLLETPEVSELLNGKSYLIIALAIVAMALFTAVLMTFLYRNLLRFFFSESQSWQTIDFCYLTSVIVGVLLAIITIAFNRNIEMSVIGRMTNLTTVFVINLLFYLLNRNLKEQLLVAVISILNASAVIFL